MYRNLSYLDAPVEPSTFARFFVVVPFRPLGRNPYLRHYAQDDSAPVSAFQVAWAKNANTVFNANRMGRGVIV